VLFEPGPVAVFAGECVKDVFDASAPNFIGGLAAVLICPDVQAPRQEYQARDRHPIMHPTK
jgi:hypothetical protein